MRLSPTGARRRPSRAVHCIVGAVLLVMAGCRSAPSSPGPQAAQASTPVGMAEVEKFVSRPVAASATSYTAVYDMAGKIKNPATVHHDGRGGRTAYVLPGTSFYDSTFGSQEHPITLHDSRGGFTACRSEPRAECVNISAATSQARGEALAQLNTTLVFNVAAVKYQALALALPTFASDYDYIVDELKFERKLTPEVRFFVTSRSSPAGPLDCLVIEREGDDHDLCVTPDGIPADAFQTSPNKTLQASLVAVGPPPDPSVFALPAEPRVLRSRT